MSNPYGPPSGDGEQPQQPPSYGTPPPPPSSPYGTPPPPGGGAPYGQPYGGYGGPPPGGAKPGADGISIAAFVLSLTCCLSVVGAILGFVGLKRTKDNQRGARWAAIAAIPIGILGTLALIAGIVGIVFFAKATLSLDEAKVGQCITVDDDDSDSVILYKKDCSDSHEGEIVYAGTADNDATDLQSANAGQVCVSRASTVLDDIDSSKFQIHVLAEDPDDVDADDRFVCYVTLQGGGKYKGKAADQ